MKTEHRLADALKKAMSETSLDAISVTTLTKKCQISRKTFYYHFHDIYDLLTLVFLDEHIDGIENTNNCKEMLSYIFNHYKANHAFINATLNSAGKDLYEEFVYNNCYQSMIRFLAKIDTSKKVHYQSQKAVARFYAQAFSNTVVYYFTAYKTKTLQGLLSCFVFIEDNFLESAIKRMAEKKKTND